MLQALCALAIRQPAASFTRVTTICSLILLWIASAHAHRAALVQPDSAQLSVSCLLMSIFFSLQREETLKQKKELSQELANLRDELGKNVRPSHVLLPLSRPFAYNTHSYESYQGRATAIQSCNVGAAAARS